MSWDGLGSSVTRAPHRAQTVDAPDPRRISEDPSGDSPPPSPSRGFPSGDGSSGAARETDAATQ